MLHLAGLALTAYAALAQSTDHEVLGDIAGRWKALYNGGDAARVAELYIEDGYYLSSHVLAHKRPAIQSYFQRGISGGGHIDWIRPLKIHVAGELAYFAGTYQATNAGVTVDGRLLLVLQKVDGKWLIAAHEVAVRDQP